MSKQNKRSKKIVSFLVILGVLLLIGSPWIHWAWQPLMPLHLKIVDKTVPERNFREHAALVWVLNHFKIPHLDGRAWNKETDYRGYVPEDPISHKPAHGEDLQEADLRGQDLLFIADSYGVYTQDKAEARHEKAPDYSRKIYGGFDQREVGLIENFVGSGKSLIAEFNTFASPTKDAPRERLEKLLGLKWTEWSGRFFAELSHPTEIPAWARRNWKKQTGKEWAFKGPGFLFVHENSRVVVLEENKDVHPEGLKIFKASDHPYMKGVGTGIPFHYWFDIIKPLAGTEVLAEYRLDLTQSGADLLTKEGIPHQFPAVLLKSKPSLRLYLAGDASDNALDMGNPSWSGRQTWFKIWPFNNPNAEQIDFFWRCYEPLLRNVFNDLSHQYYPEQGNSHVQH
jgi:hypothetical protein